MRQLTLGERERLGFTESSTGNQLTNKHQIGACLKSCSFPGVKCLLPLRIHRFEASITRYGCLLLKKTSCHTLYGDDTNTCFCTAAQQSQVLIENTGLQMILLSIKCKYSPPFPKNALGIIWGLGLFQVSPVEAPLSDV